MQPFEEDLSMRMYSHSNAVDCCSWVPGQTEQGGLNVMHAPSCEWRKS